MSSLLWLLAACPSSVPSPESSTPASETEPVLTSYAWLGAFQGQPVLRAWMEREQREDGTERLRGVSEIDLSAFEMPLVWRLAEEVELSADGEPLSWIQHHQHDEWGTHLESRYRYESEGRSLEVAHQGMGGQWSLSGPEPVLLVPWTTEPYLDLPAPSVVAPTVLHRLMSRGEDFAQVYPSSGQSVTMPAAAPGACGELQGDRFCWDEEGVVDTYQPLVLLFEAERVEELPELPFFEVPPAQTQVDTPDCALPAPGDPRHRTFQVPSADGTVIAGRMVLPEGPGPWSAVSLQSGSGGVDRRGSYNGLGHWDCAAAHLSAQGIAVISVDDRGWGQSGGSVSDSFVGRDEDAVAVAQWALEQPEVESLFLVGHSEGVAHACAASAQVPEIEGLVLMSGPSGLYQGLLSEQDELWLTEAGADTATIEANRDASAAFWQEVSQGAYDGTEINGQPVDTYWKPLLAADGTALALATHGPVLLVQGGSDWQVAPRHAEALLEALQAAGREVELQLEPELGHLLQPALGGQALGLEYGLPWAIDPVVLDNIHRWIRERP